MTARSVIIATILAIIVFIAATWLFVQVNFPYGTIVAFLLACLIWYLVAVQNRL